MATHAQALNQRTITLHTNSTSTQKAIVVPGFALGTLLFLLHNLGVWAGCIGAPKGFEPLLYPQNWDSNQYLAFLTLARTHLLFPNLHAPWHTDPAMLNPMFLASGRIGGWLGLTPLATLHAMQFMMLLAAGCALVWVLRVLFPTRAQRVAAVVVTLCALPLTMFALSMVRWLAPSTFPLFLLGTVELGYMSADGVVRSGLSNSPTLTFGTATVLLALGLTAMRLRTGQMKYTWLLSLTALVSAAMHPFEVFVIVPSAAAALLILGRVRWFEAALPALGAALGLSPYVVLSMLHPWFRELSQTFRFDASLGGVIMAYGVPLLAVPYLLLMGARPKERAGWLAPLWWILTLGISLTPGAPFPPHLMDGFAIITGITVVQLSSHSKFQAIFKQHRRGLSIGLAGILCMVTAAYAGMYQQIFRDAKSVDGALLHTIASHDEIAVLDELRHRGRVEDLALAPEPLSMMLVRAPMHSFASHEHLSFDYHRQSAQAAKFYSANMTTVEAEAFLSDYGIRWVVFPEDGAAVQYLGQQQPAFVRGRLRVYELSGNSMKPYPGIAKIVPPERRQKSLAEFALSLIRR